jgi:predicted NBD/HSP70 family sugar kinase
LLAAGVSVPGLVQRESGLVANSIELGAEALPVQARFQGFPAPVYVDNDANCSAWNALEPDDHRNIVLAQVKLHQDADGTFRPSGAGIGLALVVEGTLYYGSNNASGEVRGVSWTRESRDQLGLRLDHLQAEHGTVTALRALARELLRTLSVVATVFDPDLVIIAGDLADRESLVRDELREALGGTAISEMASQGTLHLAGPDEYPAARGAALMVLSSLFHGGGQNGAPLATGTVVTWHEAIAAVAAGETTRRTAGS